MRVQIRGPPSGLLAHPPHTAVSCVRLEAITVLPGGFLLQKGGLAARLSQTSGDDSCQREHSMDLHPGQTFVASDGPYNGCVLKIVGKDPKKPGQDRWLFESPDGQRWGAPGERLRAALEQQRQAEAAAPTEEVLPADTAAAEDQPQAETEATVLPTDGQTEAAAKASPPPSVAAEPTATAQPAQAEALDFAHTPVKIVIQLWADEGEGRTAWIGGDLPDHNPLSASLTNEQVAEVLHLFAGLLDQLEAEFPARQAKIVAALAADSRTSYVPPARTTSAPATRPKPAGRTPKGTPLTTVPAGADQPKPTPGPSPERQAYLATIQQPDMFATVPEATPAPAAHSEAH